MGTPYYIVARAANGSREGRPRAAISYAVGVMMYEAVTGQVPFDAKIVQRASCSRSCCRPRRPPLTIVPDLDVAFLLDRVQGNGRATSRNRFQTSLAIRRGPSRTGARHRGRRSPFLPSIGKPGRAGNTRARPRALGRERARSSGERARRAGWAQVGPTTFLWEPSGVALSERQKRTIVGPRRNPDVAEGVPKAGAKVPAIAAGRWIRGGRRARRWSVRCVQAEWGSKTETTQAVVATTPEAPKPGGDPPAPPPRSQNRPNPNQSKPNRSKPKPVEAVPSAAPVAGEGRGRAPLLRRPRPRGSREQARGSRAQTGQGPGQAPDFGY